MWWTAADRTQKVVTLGGIGALLFLLVGTTLFATRTQYETLFSGLSEMEKGQIVEGLTTLGIPEEHGEPGVIKVPKGKTEDAMMGLAKAQKLPKESGHWDLEKYKDISMGTSPEMEGQIIKAVLEGRLARTIEHSDGVASATVLLNIPEKRVFAENNDHPTASVTLVEGGQGTMSRANGRVIANLVCNAVDGMTPADVFVASNSLGVLWDGKQMGPDSTGGSTKAEMDAKASRDMEANIQAALDPVFGAGNTKVMVSADLDLDRKTSHDDNTSPADRPTTVQKISETMSGGKPGAAGGTVGATPNTSAKALSQPTTAGTSGSQDYKSTKQTSEFGENHHVQDTNHAVGGYAGLTITAIVNSEKVTDPKAVQNILNGFLAGKMKLDAQGVPVADQPFSATVTSVKFDGSAGAAAKAAADAAAGQQRMQQIMSLLPIGAILIVALLVAKQVGKISRSVLPAPMVADETLAEGMGPDALPSGMEDSDMSPAALSAQLDRTPQTEEEIELEEFKKQVDIPLESIKKMAGERPEMVATLIKSMMLGERS